MKPNRYHVVYDEAWSNYDYSFQINQAKINKQYVFTLWSFFPHNWLKKSSVEYRFLANALSQEQAQKTFKAIDIEELPYTEGFWFPRFSDDDKAMEFLESDLFLETYQPRKDE